MRDHLGRPPEAEAGRFGPGAALVADDAAWILVEDEPDRGLGPALAWALRQGAGSLHLLAESSTGLLGRRAEAFDWPIAVWHVEGRMLLPAVAEPLAPPPPARPDHEALIPVIADGGARPVVEHGVVLGEVRGLEVCRVVDDPVSGVVRLEVGVGVHDRAAFALIHGDVPTVEALRGVVDAVERHRRPGAVDHPLSRLVPERLVRWQLEQAPGSIGLASLVPCQPPVRRRNVKDRMACTALGTTPEGDPVVVVGTAGVDLDVVPFAADAAAAVALTDPARAEADVWIAGPARDLVPITAELSQLLHRPPRLVALPG